MRPEELKRLKQLKKKRRRADLNDAEDSELYALSEKRQAEVTLAVPRPTCCEAAAKHPVVTFTLDYNDDRPSDEAEGVWVVSVHERRNYAIRAALNLGWEPPPPPKFCAFCGAALPKMVRKNPLPKGICKVTDGGNYCDTCGERLDSCLCDPIQSAFEPEKMT